MKFLAPLLLGDFKNCLIPSYVFVLFFIFCWLNCDDLMDYLPQFFVFLFTCSFEALRPDPAGIFRYPAPSFITTIEKRMIFFKGILWEHPWKPAIYRYLTSYHIDAAAHLFFTEIHFCSRNFKESYQFQSDPSSNCFTIDVWKIKWWIHHVIVLLSYCYLCPWISFTQVMECFDMCYFWE